MLDKCLLNVYKSLAMIDLTGKKFGMLTVIKRDGADNQRNPTWLCKCDCGNEKIVRGNLLKSGNTKSCGCINREKVKMLNFVTGAYKSRLHRIWDAMKQRCLNQKNNNYHRYGARGIMVCEEWRNNFKAFYDWAMGNGYTDDLTIDRIDNDGNYCPENCRWATLHEQNRNRRTSRMITFNGKTQCMLDWAKELEIKPITMVARFRRGWSVERAFNTPIKH